MPPLVNDDTFRDRFVIKNDVPVSDYVSTASETVKEWVGTEVYTDAEKLDVGAGPTDLPRAKRLRLAELYLAMYYYYPAASIQIESGVIVMTDRSEGENGGVIRSFEKPEQRREGREGFYDAAREIAAPYLLLPARIGSRNGAVRAATPLKTRLIF
jgi:hypothetical protein